MAIREELNPHSGGAPPPPMGVKGTVLFFGFGAAMLGIVIHGLIPAADGAGGFEPVVWWFLLAGSVFLLPLLAASAWLLRREPGYVGRDLWRDRLRFRRMDAGDWLWTLGTLAAIGALSLASMVALRALPGGNRPMFFVPMEPLGPGRYWLLGAWLPFFAANILIEEFAWRGVALPRQERAFGSRAWLVNGAAHLLLHLPTGAAVLLVLWPTAFLLPHAAQRRRNTWVGVVIHGTLNGPGFLASAFGLV